MKRLLGEEGRAFEEHLLICPECAKTVEDAAQYVQAIRAAARGLRAQGGDKLDVVDPLHSSPN
jgi:hypothetical protein